MVAPEHRSADSLTRSMKIVRANCSEKHEGVLTKRPIKADWGSSAPAMKASP